MHNYALLVLLREARRVYPKPVVSLCQEALVPNNGLRLTCTRQNA